MQSALGRAAGQQASALAGPAYAELRAIAKTDQIYSYTVLDVKQATQTILLPLMSWMMLANPGKMTMNEQTQLTALVTQILPQIGTAASIETVQDGLAMGYFKLKM